MRIISISIVMGLLIPVAAIAQDKVKFRSINMAGITTGKSGSYGIIQTVNGLEYKKVFAGIGAGIDYYKNRSIPLFFNLTTSVAKTNLYAFGDIGYNFPSHDIAGKEVYYYSNYHFSGGLYTELGIGYKILLARKNYLLFSSGFSYKEVNNKVGTQNPCPSAASCPVDYTKYQYGYGRIVFKAGVSF